MLFSVLFSADVPDDVRIQNYTPPQAEILWDQTEGDEGYEYRYLEGQWEDGHHRKWAAVLDRDEFEEFVGKLGLYAETTETMGSLGAPGFGFGWSPAISFRGDDEDAILSAYVTPIPEVKKERFDDHDWERVRQAVLSVYGKKRVRAVA